MIKLLTLVLLTSTTLVLQLSAQTNAKKFVTLAEAHDTAGQRQLLSKWEMSNKNDPELFVAYFNYYVTKSRTDVIEIGHNPKGKDALVVMELDTSIKEPAGFIYDGTTYDKSLLSKGFSWIKKGIDMYPSRLDMRFGKIYMLGLIEDYETFTNEIIRTIDYSTKNNNKWKWSNNEPKDSGEQFLLSNIQGYQVQLYNTENDTLLNNMKRIAEAVLKYYPNHIESLSNISIVYMLQNKYDKALEPLLKAEKLSPQDYIVLSNIAQAYKLNGDNANAIKYYELTAKYGDEQAIEYAQKQIELLKKK